MNIVREIIKACLATVVVVIILPVASISFLWFWEMAKAKDVLDRSLQALMVGNSPPGIDISFENQKETINYGKTYSIEHTDSLLVWGQWYCVEFDNGAALGLQIFPSVFENHRVKIVSRGDCL